MAGTLWIAKPSYANKGSEILVFSSYEELEVHLLEWHSLREWVVQRYIERPLLFQKRKFHFRYWGKKNVTNKQRSRAFTKAFTKPDMPRT